MDQHDSAAGFGNVLRSNVAVLPAAFLPYTYCAFIKAPPYPWMPWFTHHQAALVLGALAAGAMRREWRDLCRELEKSAESARHRNRSARRLRHLPQHQPISSCPSEQSGGVLVGPGILAPAPRLLCAVGVGITCAPADPKNNRLFGYSVGLQVAIVVSVIYTIGARMQIYSANRCARISYPRR